MKDTKKTKSQLIDELVQMRQRVAELEASEAERKRAEEALQESEERYRLLAENVTDVIWAVDANLRLTYVSPSVTQLRGYSVEEAMGQRFEEWLTPASLEVVAKIMAEEEATEDQGGEPLAPPMMELELTCKDGSTVWTELGIADMLDQDGQVVGTLGISRDITERRRAEEAVRESEEKLRFMFESIEDGIMVTDLQGNIVDFNEAVLRKHGYNHKEEIIGRNAFELISPKDHARLMADLGKVIEGDSSRSRKEYTLLTSDGSDYEAEFSYGVMRDSSGNPEGLIGVMRDITERRRVEEALRESEERLRALIQNAPDAIYTNDLRGNFIGGNRKAEEMMGYSRQELTGSNFFEKGILPQEYVPKAIEALEKNRRGEPTGPDEFELVRKDGSRVVVEISTFPVNRGGEVEVMGIARDITERKRAEMELKVRDSAIASSINAIAMADLEGKLIYVNPSFLELWGYDNDKEVLGRPAIEFWEMGEQAAVVVQALFEKGGWRGELTAQRKNGSVFDVELSSSMVTDEYDKPFRLMASFIDITERKKAEETIKHLAYHDTLTGLPNRPLFNEILTLELARAQRNQQQVAVMLLDLDEFKHVNDTLGHPIGDQLLKAVADRMRRSVRKADTVARMGGDEFMLILPDMTRTEYTAKVAQKILDAFTKPFVIEDHKLHITSSIGIAIYPHDGEDSETLMKNADIAMYRAKEQGRNNYQYYTPVMNGRVLVDS